MSLSKNHDLVTQDNTLLHRILIVSQVSGLWHLTAAELQHQPAWLNQLQHLIHEQMHVSFCAVIQREKFFLRETAHNRVCGLS